MLSSSSNTNPANSYTAKAEPGPMPTVGLISSPASEPLSNRRFQEYDNSLVMGGGRGRFQEFGQGLRTGAPASLGLLLVHDSNVTVPLRWNC